MNKKQKIVVGIICIFFLILGFLGFTYSYFLTKIIGNTNNNSLEITTANLKLIYNDGNNYVKLVNALPGTIITKTFTVTNEGNEKIEDYVVYLENIINNFRFREDVKYTLTCTSVNKMTQESSGSCSGINNLSFPRQDSILVMNDIDIGIMHKYVLRVEYLETWENQSADMSKTVSAKVNIYDRKKKNFYVLDSSNMTEYLDNLDKLEDYVVTYLNNNATSTENGTYLIDKTKWLVFSSISKLSYDSNNWTIVAGPKDTAFLTYLSDNNFDINIFKSQYIASDENEYSGITHFSAALAASLYNTNAIYNLVMDEIDYNNLAGWAGDLQTLIANNVLNQVTDQNNYDEIYNLMLSLIGRDGTYFDSDDLYADVDALNIYKLLKSSKSIKDIMEDYYSEGYKNRFYSFVKNVASSYDYESLKNAIYVYTQYSTSWPLYSGVSSFSDTFEEATRDAFTDYIWYLANLKNIEIYSEILKYEKGNSINLYAEYIDRNGVLDKTITNTDFNWSVSKEDGSACVSSIDSNGILSISSEETSSKLVIKVTLKKSNKVIGKKTIDII